MDDEEHDPLGHRIEHYQIATLFKVLDIYRLVLEASAKEPGRKCVVGPECALLIVQRAQDGSFELEEKCWGQYGAASRVRD